MLQPVSSKLPAVIASVREFLEGGKGKKGIYAESGGRQRTVCWEEGLQKLMRPTEIQPDLDHNQELPIIVFAENILIPQQRKWAVLLAEYSNGMFFLELRVHPYFVRKAERELGKFLKY